MRNLFTFLYRSRIFLLFLALEIIAFWWISDSRSYQRSAMIHSANDVTGFFLEKTGNLTDYFHLDKQNERLAEENARLRSLSPMAFYDLDSSFTTEVDSSYLLRYRFMEGAVISSSFRKERNYMTLNRGRIHGVEPEMGVMGSNGIVGIVDDVSERFATVIPVINPLFRISGKINSTGYFGPVIWKNGNYRYAYLTDIPRYANIQPGDTVSTDSRTLTFPEGVPIGVIRSFELQEDQNFYEIKIELTTDFSSIGYIYIVHDTMKEEIENLQSRQE